MSQICYSTINKATQFTVATVKERKKKKGKIMREKKAIYFVSSDWSRVVNQQKRISHRLKRRPTGSCNFFPFYIWKNRFGVNLTLNFVQSILFLNSLPLPLYSYEQKSAWKKSRINSKVPQYQTFRLKSYVSDGEGVGSPLGRVE